MRPRPSRLLLLIVAAASVLRAEVATALNLQRLEPADLDTLQSILHILEPSVSAQQRDGTAVLLTWEALYAPLSASQRAFLDVFRTLRGDQLGSTAHYFGEPATPPALVPIGRQQVVKDGLVKVLDPQYLPSPVLEAYQRMMEAMGAALGKRLLVESGYRSAAYQLYLFLFYLPKHDDSIVETNRFVALPGHSEHGAPSRQAIDFINEDGINGEDHPEEFEALPEYRWLQQHAHEYGFALSYPRDNPFHTAFEPWHWHYESP